MRLLIVDDDAYLAVALQRRLRREPWFARIAHSAAEAIEMVAVGSIDAVISDYRLGQFKPSGLDLLATIAACQPSVCRILMSAERVVDESGAAQVVLSKPFELEELVAALDVLGRQTPLPG